MYLRPIPLSVIGDRAHGEKSINGVKTIEKGPATKDELNDLVDTASQRGVTLTCKDMRAALAYFDHKMYKKLKIGTDIGKLKILPLNGGTVTMPVVELNSHCRPMTIRTEWGWRHGRTTTATTSTRPCVTTSDDMKYGRRRTVTGAQDTPDYNVMKPDGSISWSSCTMDGSSTTKTSVLKMTDLLPLTTGRNASTL